MKMLQMVSFLTATETVSADTFQSVLNAITGQISVETVVGILAACAGVGVGFAFMWWGVRKVVGALMTAFKKGKIRL